VSDSGKIKDRFPPRGSGVVGDRGSLPRHSWLNPAQLDARWDWQHGKLLLGMHEGRVIAEPDRTRPVPMMGDDRHIVTIAGSRAGKSSTVLIPNLRRYPSSVVVIDPKGELARETVKARIATGQHVVILDPFGVSGWESGSYNPFDELDADSDTFVDDVGLVADALIIDAQKDTHWTDAAKNFLRGLILYMFATGEATLPRLRRLIMAAEGAIRPRSRDQDDKNTDGELLIKMKKVEAFGGLVSLVAQTMLDKYASEFNSILSVAREQIAFLDSEPLAKCLQSSSLRINQIKHQPTTIYLVLPATRLATHAKWLRVILSLAIVEMERDTTVPEHPILLMLEEFAALGYLRPIEFASGFMAGFGVRLWPILQDLSQLKTHYEKSWETFLGNAGIIQAFGNADRTTTEYLSNRLGKTLVMEKQEHFTSVPQLAQGDPGSRKQPRSTPLIEPDEISLYFARDTNRQIILVPEFGPAYANRLPFEKRADNASDT
jgi:type IV secretion system protein VirD4